MWYFAKSKRNWYFAKLLTIFHRNVPIIWSRSWRNDEISVWECEYFCLPEWVCDCVCVCVFVWGSVYVSLHLSLCVHVCVCVCVCVCDWVCGCVSVSLSVSVNLFSGLCDFDLWEPSHSQNTWFGFQKYHLKYRGANHLLKISGVPFEKCTFFRLKFRISSIIKFRKIQFSFDIISQNINKFRLDFAKYNI